MKRLTMDPRIRSTLLMLILCFSVSNCGKKGRSEQVTFSYSPETPIVINADIEIGDDFTCSKPWFMLNFTITNNSDRIAVLQVIHIETEAVVNGTTTTGTSDIVSTVDGVPYITVIQQNDSESGYAYVCGLQKADDLTFAATGEAIGWFGGTDTSVQSIVSAVERLSKVFSFTAQ